jgi:hypothetical protein
MPAWACSGVSARSSAGVAMQATGHGLPIFVALICGLFALAAVAFGQKGRR